MGDQAAIYPDLPKRPPWIAKEETGDNRLGSTAYGTPAVKALCHLEARHPHARRGPWMGDDVDGRLRAVGQLDAQQLVSSSVSSLV